MAKKKEARGREPHSGGRPDEQAEGESCAPQPDKSPQRRPIPIVAIGASAGGLEALRQFFDRMPSDAGIGFVVVTHMQPGRETMLPELLSRVTDMAVLVSQDGLRVQPNTVVVAKDSVLSVSGGVLHHEREPLQPDPAHHLIDHFFRSLATDRKERAIGIVLSGTGSDGTVGLKAIKAAGGMIMIQDPDTANPLLAAPSWTSRTP